MAVDPGPLSLITTRLFNVKNSFAFEVLQQEVKEPYGDDGGWQVDQGLI